MCEMRGGYQIVGHTALIVISDAVAALEFVGFSHAIANCVLCRGSDKFTSCSGMAESNSFVAFMAKILKNLSLFLCNLCQVNFLLPSWTQQTLQKFALYPEAFSSASTNLAKLVFIWSS